MSVANKVLVYRWYEEVWNKKRESAIDEMLTPDVVLYGLTDSPTEAVRGCDAFRKYWRELIAAFPDLHVSVESTIAEDDKVAARCSLRATHTGTGMGVAPTGKRVHISGVRICTFRDSMVTEAWNNFDTLSLYRQLGILPTGGFK